MAKRLLLRSNDSNIAAWEKKWASVHEDLDRRARERAAASVDAPQYEWLSEYDGLDPSEAERLQAPEGCM